MDHESRRERTYVSEAIARHVLARAAELDAAGGEVAVARLREAAREAGIAPAAVEAALAELQTTTPATRPPWWVRLCLFGVPDRRTALGFYWLFVAGICGSPLLTLAPGGDVGRLGAFGAIGFCTFALWSTSRAIRWLDEHGWDSLR